MAISLAIVMITLLVILTAGWVVMAVLGALRAGRFTGWYWLLLSLGTAFIVALLVGVVLYLILSIKAINLNRRQSNFIDSVTHELKSPIASMKLYLQTLSRRRVSQEETAEFYRFMLEDVERLDHLINQILDAGRLESRGSPGDIEEVGLPELLRQCARAVCASYHVPPETIQLRVEPCAVWAKPSDLDLLFRNLIDNAVKYGGAEPEVLIEAQGRPGGKIVVRIADNGQGIPPRWRRKVFARFVRLGVELERERSGTGLGLYIVRTLVRRMRGRIRIHSRDSGPGTVFEVELPGGTPPVVNAAT
jgi:signal transduction histidine kinase